MSCPDEEEPICFGRHGWASGYHLPEAAEEQRATGEIALACRGCILRAECRQVTAAIADVPFPSMAMAEVFTANLTAGLRARHVRAGVSSA